MRRPVYFFAAAAIGALCIAFALWATVFAQAPVQPIEEKVMKACSACHDTGKVCKALGSRSAEEWSKTVQRMVNKGAKVSPEEIPAVSSYLAGLNKGAMPVCK